MNIRYVHLRVDVMEKNKKRYILRIESQSDIAGEY